jgi:hypothetical protein
VAVGRRPRSRRGKRGTRRGDGRLRAAGSGRQSVGEADGARSCEIGEVRGEADGWASWHSDRGGGEFDSTQISNRFELYPNSFKH